MWKNQVKIARQYQCVFYCQVLNFMTHFARYLFSSYSDYDIFVDVDVTTLEFVITEILRICNDHNRLSVLNIM